MIKLFAFVFSSVLLSNQAMAFTYQTEDVVGRLRIATQTDTSVLASIDVRLATPADNVLGSVVADVDLSFKGAHYTHKKCFGRFDEEELSLGLICGEKVINITLSGDTENKLSYVNGSFTSAQFTYVTLPLTDKSEKIDVEMKNLSLRR